MISKWQNSPAAKDYSVDELMVTVMATQFRDGDQCCNGMASFIPVAAFMLAKRTHAPDLVWLPSSVGLESRPDRIPAPTQEQVRLIREVIDPDNMRKKGFRREA